MFGLYAIYHRVNCRSFASNTRTRSMFSAVLLVDGRPKCSSLSTDSLSARKRANQLYTHFLLTIFYSNISTNISRVSVTVLLNLKQNLMLSHWSVAFWRSRLETLFKWMQQYWLKSFAQSPIENMSRRVNACLCMYMTSSTRRILRYLSIHQTF